MPLPRLVGLTVIALFGWHTPASAQSNNPLCMEAWIIRNMIFDVYGLCFSSTLGQALFDNSGCTSSGAMTLAPPDAAVVTRINELEQRIGCSVDTGQMPGALASEMYGRLSTLLTIPEPDELGSGCLGYRGEPVPLYSGAGTSTAQIGQIPTGGSVYFEYMPVEGWAYVTVTNGPGQPILSHGWSAPGTGPRADSDCTQWVG